MSDPIPLPELKTAFFRRCNDIAVHLDTALFDTEAVQAMLTPSERGVVEEGKQPDLPLARWAALFFRLSDELETREVRASLEWHDYMAAYCREVCGCNCQADHYDEGDFAVYDDDIPF